MKKNHGSQPNRGEKSLRRRGIGLYLGALLLGLLSAIVGILLSGSLPAMVCTVLFWSVTALAVIAFVLNLLLDHLHHRSFSGKSVADMQAYIGAHREDAEAVADRKLAFLRKVRILSHVYTAVLALFGAVCGVCGGCLTVGDTTYQTPVMLWSGFLYLCAISRIHFPEPRAFLEEDPMLAKPEDYPRLYEIARKAAKSQGWDGEILIRFTTDCNAGIHTESGRCCIHMGVLLLNLLTEEELLAVFCHEFFHVIREAATDSPEYRHNGWLAQGGNPHFLSGLTSLFFAFPDGVYILHFQMYRYAQSLALETQADQAMVCLASREAAAAALVKLKYNDLFQWESGTYNEPCLYAPEKPNPRYLHRLMDVMGAHMAKRSELWNTLIDREIIARNASHPTAKMRLEALGVTQIPAISLPEADTMPPEWEKALSFAARTVCDSLGDTYEQDRQEAYLQPLALVEAWENTGKPIVAEEYANVDMALRSLGRNLEADALCCQAMEELPGAAGIYALYMHGCFLLCTYQDEGIDLIYRAIAGNHNYIEGGLETIGQYCCLTGNQQALDAYRQTAVELLQKTKDVYEEMGTLRKGDRLTGENLPEGMLEALLAYMRSVDENAIDAAYLVRKHVTQEEFTSALVVRFRKETSEDVKESVMDKLFSYLDTSSDWQFSLFDYEDVAKVKVEAVPGSCIYTRKKSE